VSIRVGQPAPHQSIAVSMVGGFVRKGPTDNVAHTVADNAEAVDSNQAHVHAVGNEKFKLLKRQLEQHHQNG
jgi:hypothetical protein